MPKRKRGENGDSGPQPTSSTTVLQKRAEEKIFHCRKVVQRSLKVAKGFERQKLSRRQKTATQEKKAEEIARINDEIEALKNLNLESCAQSHLYKVLLKQKDVASSPRLPPSVAALNKPTLDTATANVTARLYNAKPVKDALAGVLVTIRAALGLESTNGSKKSTRTLPQDIEGAVNGRDQPQPEYEDSLSGSDAASHEEALGADDTPPTPSRRRVDMDISDDSEAFADLDAQVVASSDEDDTDDMEGPQRTDSDENAEDLDVSSSLSDDASPIQLPPKKKVPAKQTERATAKFMPSLTMGGYVEGSDSEPEPFDDQPQRKNRRGQRARQAIWEKKFGKGAKHLQKDATAGGEGRGPGKRDEGWDPKRGAQVGGSAAGKGYKPRWQQDREQRKRSGEDAASGGNAMELGPRKALKKASSQPNGLHPSWEAAKKAKEQKQQAAAFSGKKMVFN